MFVSHIQKQSCSRSLSVLFDPGSRQSYLNRRAMPDGAVPFTLYNPIYSSTAAGPLKVRNSANLSQLTFPEFSKSLKFENLQCLVFDQPEIAYDVILGRDFLNDVKMDICYLDTTMKWND